MHDLLVTPKKAGPSITGGSHAESQPRDLPFSGNSRDGRSADHSFLPLRLRERRSKSPLFIGDSSSSRLRPEGLPHRAAIGQAGCAPTGSSGWDFKVHTEAGLQRTDEEVRVEIRMPIRHLLFFPLLLCPVILLAQTNTSCVTTGKTTNCQTTSGSAQTSTNCVTTGNTTNCQTTPDPSTQVQQPSPSERAFWNGYYGAQQAARDRAAACAASPACQQAQLDRYMANCTKKAMKHCAKHPGAEHGGYCMGKLITCENGKPNWH